MYQKVIYDSYYQTYWENLLDFRSEWAPLSRSLIFVIKIWREVFENRGSICKERVYMSTNLWIGFFGTAKHRKYFRCENINDKIVLVHDIRAINYCGKVIFKPSSAVDNLFFYILHLILCTQTNNTFKIYYIATQPGQRYLGNTTLLRKIFSSTT